MSRNAREFACRPEAVFEVLADGWLYPSWVVGASRMRDVELTWPRTGSKLHHSVGVWPAVIDDVTVSLDWSPPRRAVLQARGWPIGEATVTIDVKRRGGGCVVRLQEEPAAGPARWVPRFLIEPLLLWRNAESLRRLAFLAEGREYSGESRTLG
jgi:hypothetical protein